VVDAQNRVRGLFSTEIIQEDVVEIKKEPIEEVVEERREEKGRGEEE
jgi:hypothetical protein